MTTLKQFPRKTHRISEGWTYPIQSLFAAVIVTLVTLLPGATFSSTNKVLPKTTQANFLGLKEANVNLLRCAKAIWKNMVGLDKKKQSQWLGKIKKELSIHKDYLNLNILLQMAWATDQYLQGPTNLPFYNTTYQDDPIQLTADDGLGALIAETVNGQQGIEEYKAISPLLKNHGSLSKHGPMMKQAVIGLLSGIVSLVNPLQDIIRITEHINYGPAKKTADIITIYTYRGISQRKLLYMTANVKTIKDTAHGTIIGGINGVEINKLKHYYWLSNLNGKHLFNVPSSQSQLKHGDIVHWYYGITTEEITK